MVGSLEPGGFKFVDLLLDAGFRAFTMLSAGGDDRWFKGNYREELRIFCERFYYNLLNLNLFFIV